VLALDHAGEIVGNGARDRDPKLARLFDLLPKLRAGQQRLAGDTAPIQAQAAHGRALDEGDLRAELGCANGGHVAAGPGSDNGDAFGVGMVMKGTGNFSLALPSRRTRPRFSGKVACPPFYASLSRYAV